MRINKFLFIGTLLFILYISCSTNNNISGGSETGNPVVAGYIYNNDSTISKGTIVTLTTDNYYQNSSAGIIYKDTTDENGYYMFNDVSYGNYNLKALNEDNNTVRFTKDILIGELSETDTIQFYDTLIEYSYIELLLPEEIDTANNYLYVLGTDYFYSLSDAIKIESGEWILILDGLPDDVYLNLFIFNITDTTEPVLIDSFLIEDAGDTLDLGIFDISYVIDVNNSKLTTNTITKLLFDEANNTIWIGTYLGGLLKWDLTIDTMVLYTSSNSGLTDNYITTLALDSSGRLFIGTHQTGVNVFYNDNWSYYTNDDIPGLGNNITALEIAPNNKCLIGSPKTFAILDIDSLIVTTYESLVYEDEISSIVAVSNNDFWLGTYYSGLINIHDDTADFYLSNDTDIPDNTITTLYKCNNNNILIGTFYGVSLIDTLKSITTSIEDHSGKLDIFSFYEDSENFIWFGLQGDPSLVRYDGVNYKEYYMDYIDLTDNPGSINTILEINGKYYLGTENAGILILDENLRLIRSLNKGLSN